MVEYGGRDVGWCQWYRWADYPDDAPAYGATEPDLGIDYGIGDVALIGRGLGTALIAELLASVRSVQPGAPILVAVSTRNPASRRVLEKNGFNLKEVRLIAAEPGNEPTALYRLGAA
jgi:RimJ/RimL family protein N-acetyltransferase